MEVNNDVYNKKGPHDLWHLTLQLNARLMPMDRGGFYEEPIDYALKQMDIGEVDGGGTLQDETDEIKNCDVEIYLYEKSNAYYDKLHSFLMFLCVPKGSFLISGNDRREIGNLEGLALYLNGTDLDNEIYKSCDVNFVISEMIRLLGSEYKFHSYWQGAKETALYFYGKSFTKMNELVVSFIKQYPLCIKSRIIQVA